MVFPHRGGTTDPGDSTSCEIEMGDGYGAFYDVGCCQAPSSIVPATSLGFICKYYSLRTGFGLAARLSSRHHAVGLPSIRADLHRTPNTVFADVRTLGALG